MFDENFEDYKKRIKEYAKYSYFHEQSDSFTIFLLWEILEVLWSIGKLVSASRKDNE